MKNKIELSLIHRIINDNMLYYKTKVKLDHLNDILAKTLFIEIGKAITTTGGFIPFKDLNLLIKNQERMDKYKKLGYPLEINEVRDITDFLIENNLEETDFNVLEKNIIKDYKSKLFVNMASEMLEKASENKFNVNECLRKYSYKLDQLKYDSDDDLEFHPLDELVEEELRYQNSDEVEVFYDFGFDIIDSEVGGTPIPSTNYILAPPKTGKSTSLYELAISNLQKGRNILFVTIEIPTKEATRKMYANYTQFNYKDILQKRLSKDDNEKYIKSIKNLGEKYRDNFYMIYNKNGVDIKDIENYCENLKKSGIIIEDIYIDYLTLLNSVDDKKKSDVEKFMALPKEIRILSQKTHTRVFSAGQLDVSAIKKPIEEITLDDMHYVKNALSQEATNVLFMNREDTEDGSDLKIKHLLGRNGLNTDVYHFPNFDYNKVYLGQDIKFTYEEVDW